jgi:acyl-coenzyme A thioesterase PaaI-like protein
MSDPRGDDTLDQAWLNDHSEYQRNFVHGLRNTSGLHLQYHLAGDRVVTTWVAGEEHAGFPGFVHGGLIAAVLDDVMGRCSVLQRRWVVTGRMETRFREVAPLGAALRVEGWTTRFTRRVMQAEARMALDDGTVVAEATGTYLPVPESLLGRMVDAWPGFADYTDEPA